MKITFYIFFIFCSGIIYSQSIFQYDLIKSESGLLKEIDSLQASIDAFSGVKNLNPEETSIAVDFINNLKSGYYPAAALLSENPVLEREIRNSNYDKGKNLKTAQKIALDYEYLEFIKENNKNDIDFSDNCKSEHPEFYNEEIKFIEPKSGDKVFFYCNNSKYLLKAISEKYKDLDIYLSYSDDYDMKSAYIRYNFDKCFSKLKKDRGHRYNIVDMNNDSSGIKNIIFDKIIYSYQNEVDVIQKLKNNINKNTILIVTKVYKTRQEGKIKKVKPNKKQFKKNIARKGFEIIKTKKFHQPVSRLESTYPYKQVLTEYYGVRYKLKMKD